jgi:hypothetical protein
MKIEHLSDVIFIFTNLQTQTLQNHIDVHTNPNNPYLFDDFMKVFTIDLTHKPTRSSFEQHPSILSWKGHIGTIIDYQNCNHLFTTHIVKEITLYPHNFGSLTTLILRNKIYSLTGISKLKNLTTLFIDEHCHLDGLKELSALSNLTSFGYSNKNMIHVDFLSTITKLEHLVLIFCDSLLNIDGLRYLSNLKHVDFTFCKSLENVDGLCNATKLEYLELCGCYELKNLNGLSNATKLKQLDLSYCKKLVNLDGILHLTQLEELNLDGCAKFSNVKCDQNLYSVTFTKFQDLLEFGF